MPYLLYISVSPSGENSKSRAVADEFLSAYKSSHPSMEVVTRDLNADPVPHLDQEGIVAGWVPEENRPESMKKKLQLRQDLCKEIIEADAVVISTPMWNWAPPSVLKAYIDQIILMGTLDPWSGDANKKMKGKSVTIVIACGGGYTPGESSHPENDFESGYLTTVFKILGSTDVAVIRYELGK